MKKSVGIFGGVALIFMRTMLPAQGNGSIQNTSVALNNSASRAAQQQYSYAWSNGATGTSTEPSVLDNFYVKENTPNRRVIPYDHTLPREADIIWSKRIWRILDLKEKMNLPFYYPRTPNANRRSLWDLISLAIKEGMTVYDATSVVFDLDKSFIVPMTKTEADSNVLHYLVTVIDSNGNSHSQPSPVLSSDITRYELKEDWFFEKQRSVMDVRILGMLPWRPALDQNGSAVVGQSLPLCWIYFPAIRPMLANAEVFNTQNDAERRTYEDIFWKRQFSSYIVQESNVYNRKLEDYTKALDILLEGEAIKKKMFDLEHDMWQY